jgi:membrane fusion protein, multidrug efflux system
MHGELPAKIWTQAKSRSRRNIAVVVLIVLIAGALFYVFKSPAPQPRQGRFGADGGPVPVLVTAATKADVPVFLDAVGTIKALNTVTVSPQVDGKLLSVGFKEGDDVKKGDVLARIDPTIYEAQLNQAKAKKAQDEAQLANAKIDLERYERLAATNAVNRQQADTQRALVQQFTALVQSDQAAIENAQATLGYTAIVAPIDGRTGIRQMDEGNIVRAAGQQAIVTLTQLKPIAVTFNVPQQDLGQITAAFSKDPLPTEALRPDGDAVIDRGALRVIDNQVDQTTGTVKLKAEFPNENLQLWPGQFVNVRLLVDTLKDVVVIPTSAVQRGPNGTFVYAVKEDETVAMRPIEVQKQDENRTVVKSGLNTGERVVTTGFVRLNDGSKIAIGTSEGTPVSTLGRQRGTGQRQGGRPNRQQ